MSPATMNRRREKLKLAEKALSEAFATLRTLQTQICTAQNAVISADLASTKPHPKPLGHYTDLATDSEGGEL